MNIELRDYQLQAIEKLKTGSILCGGVGSGKSRTSLAYYFTQNNGSIKPFRKMKNPKKLYIITTARKRDTLEWDQELKIFGINREDVVVDSWNNIRKYEDAIDSFFIFDEQRVVGSGAWVKSFLKITKLNDWILLSATPGDTWMDYVPVFIANGFFKNKTEFTREHVVYSRYSKFPKVDRYLSTGRLLRMRNDILVNMDFTRTTVSHHIDIYCDYDTKLYKQTMKERWDPYNNEPIQQISGLCYILRRIVNSNQMRIDKLLEIASEHDKVIIFYNFDYELEALLALDYGKGVKIAQWNGHKHEKIPGGKKWVYLVQYTAGAEGWNCTDTDTIIFYSQNYSYKIMHQAAGRIDRLNTPFTDLYYYHFKSRSGIDLAISKALSSKKKFNESSWFGSW